MLVGAILGALVGAVLGLTGAGGGVLAVPALMLGLGLGITEAAPVALIAVGLSAAIGAISGLRQGIVRYRAAAVMALAGTLAAPAGIWLAQRLPSSVLVVIFCSVMIVVAARMLIQVAASLPAGGNPHRVSRNCMLDPSTGKFRWNARCFATLSGVGSVSGLMTGMLGVGGGFLIVPAFRHFSDLTMQASAATSIAVVALVSLATVAGTLSSGVHIAAPGWAFVAATAAGLMLGRMLSMRLQWQWLQVGFAALVLFVAACWLVRTFL